MKIDELSVKVERYKAAVRDLNKVKTVAEGWQKNSANYKPGYFSLGDVVMHPTADITQVILRMEVNRLEKLVGELKVELRIDD